MKWVGYIFAVLVALPFGWWLWAQASIRANTFDYNMRLTIEIATPYGPKTASSVLGYSYKFVPQVLGFTGFSRTMQGEAVYLDLGQGKHIIALLGHGPTVGSGDSVKVMPEKLVGEVKYWDRDKDLDQKNMFAALTTARDKLALPLVWVPTLVTYIDINEPASARVIYATGTRNLEPIPGTGTFKTEPAVLVDRITETFGPGYAFSSATIEMVPNATPVTRGIEGKLPFLVTQREKLRNQRTAPSDPYIAKFSHFVKE